LRKQWPKPQKNEIKAVMFKYNPWVYETYGYYPHYPRIYFDDEHHFIYVHRAVYWTMASSRHFSKRGVSIDSIIEGYELANFDDFSITEFLAPLGHYLQKIELIDLFEIICI